VVAATWLVLHGKNKQRELWGLVNWRFSLCTTCHFLLAQKGATNESLLSQPCVVAKKGKKSQSFAPQGPRLARGIFEPTRFCTGSCCAHCLKRRKSVFYARYTT
jgi:hypothetical protein